MLLRLNETDTYQGDFITVNGVNVPHGLGIMKSGDKTYEGLFLDGQIQLGVLYSSEKRPPFHTWNIMKGHFKNQKLNGYGVSEGCNRDTFWRFEAHYINSDINGYGKYADARGVHISGHWRNGKTCGNYIWTTKITNAIGSTHTPDEVEPGNALAIVIENSEKFEGNYRRVGNVGRYGYGILYTTDSIKIGSWEVNHVSGLEIRKDVIIGVFEGKHIASQQYVPLNPFPVNQTPSVPTNVTPTPIQRFTVSAPADPKQSESIVFPTVPDYSSVIKKFSPHMQEVVRKAEEAAIAARKVMEETIKTVPTLVAEQVRFSQINEKKASLTAFLANRCVNELTKKSDIDDIMVTSEKVSVRDPLTMRIITTPARGVRCTHLKCFDKEIWKKSNTRHCPLCNSWIFSEKDLVVDNNMKALLGKVKNIGDDVCVDYPLDQPKNEETAYTFLEQITVLIKNQINKNRIGEAVSDIDKVLEGLEGSADPNQNPANESIDNTTEQSTSNTINLEKPLTQEKNGNDGITPTPTPSKTIKFRKHNTLYWKKVSFDQLDYNTFINYLQNRLNPKETLSHLSTQTHNPVDESNFATCGRDIEYHVKVR